MPARVLMVQAGSMNGSSDRESYSISLIYLVQVDYPATEGIIAAAAAPELPRYGAPYRFGSERDDALRAGVARYRSFNKANAVYEFEIEYKSKLADKSGQDPQDSGNDLRNPLLRPPDIDWDGQEYQKELETDVAGKAVVMPNGQRPQTPLMAQRTKGVLRIARNESRFDHVAAEEYANTTNSSVFWGAARHTCTFKRPKASAKFEAGLAYWRVAYEIFFHGETVTEMKLNEGSFYFPGGIGVGDKTFPRDRFGMVSSENIPLQANGDKLSDADIKAGNFTYTDFEAYNASDWSRWGLDYSALFS